MFTLASSFARTGLIALGKLTGFGGTAVPLAICLRSTDGGPFFDDD